MSSSNCCFLTCIQIHQESGQVVWYSHLFQNFPQFVVIHTVKGFGIVNKAEIDVFLELSCFFYRFVNLLVSCSVMSDSLWPHGLQHVRLPRLTPSNAAWSHSCLLSQWFHPTISSSVVPFTTCLQSFPASGSFPMGQHFASGGQSIGVSASASFLPMNIQDWFPLGWTGWISLQSKGLSRVFSNTIVQKHQFFSTQHSLWFNSHIRIWPLEKP